MSTGCVMLDVAGHELTDKERQRLQHPHVGGLILFARNYQSKQQLRSLVADIRQVAPDIIIAVDQEGGRVQRFRDEFMRLPAMKVIADRWLDRPKEAVALSEMIGWLMAAELIDLDIDISFAPVLDLNLERSQIIGDRAFGSTPEQVMALASAFMKGMHSAGMAATGKHFPGHGWVIADSHLAVPTDERPFSVIAQQDMQPFKFMIEQGLDAIMPAHVIYTQVTENTAGFSPFWLQEVLRQQLGFEGVIFSDDLSMEGASVAGGYPERAAAALKAGCDMVLVCNKPEAADQVLGYLDSLEDGGLSHRSLRISRMRHKNKVLDQLRIADVKQQVEMELA